MGLTDLILCEVLQGIRDDAVFTQVHHDLLRFQVFSTGGADLAVASAQNYRSLRKRGITVRKTIDCLIATFCLDSGHSLLHRARDYDPFEAHLGLQVIHPRISHLSAGMLFLQCSPRSLIHHLTEQGR
jgi:predicted nucleic acid-binding protein